MITVRLLISVSISRNICISKYRSVQPVSPSSKVFSGRSWPSIKHLVNTIYWPYTAYTWFIQLLLWRNHMVKATLKIELCEIEVENTSRELLIFEYQAWFETRLRPSSFAHFYRLIRLRLFSNQYKRVQDHFILQLNGNVTQVGSTSRIL